MIREESLLKIQKIAMLIANSLLYISIGLWGIGFICTYFSLWFDFFGKGFFSFVFSALFIEASPLSMFFLGIKSGYTFAECFSMFFMPTLLIPIVHIFSDLYKYSRTFLNNSKNKAITISRWFLFIPLTLLIEYLVQPIGEYLINSVFFFYPNTIKPILFSPFLWNPISVIISFEIMHLIIPNKKKVILFTTMCILIIAHFINLSLLGPLSEVFSFDNLFTIISIFSSPIIAYFTTIHIFHIQEKE